MNDDTGTDRVELTEDERAEIDCGCGGFADGAIERVISARLASLIAERDRLRVQLEQVDAKGGIADLFGERDMWRKTAERYEAELAAANTRCAELENIIDREGFVEAKLRAERDALQIRLDSLAKLFAALTPEGSP